MPLSRLCYITIDCNDLNKSYDFWSRALNADNESFGDYRDDMYRRMKLPGTDIRMILQLVPETKTAKSPVHVCIESDDVQAESHRLISLGASIVDRHDEFDRPFNVLADPFGNEFCIIQPAYPDLLEARGKR